MADVLQKVIEASGYINGAAIVSAGPIAQKHTYRLAQTINDNTGVGSISGVLDTRFDDPRYYTGDSGVG
jgi:hypothetical protein